MKAWKRWLECPLWGRCPLPQWLGSSKDSLMLSSPDPDLDLALPLLRLDLVEGRISAWSGWVWACRYLYLFTLGWKHINLNGSEVTRGATSLLDGNTSTPTQKTHSRIHICLLYFVFCQGYYLLPVTVSVLKFLLLQKNKCFSSWQSTVLLSFCVCLDILDQIWSSVLKR